VFTSSVLIQVYLVSLSHLCSSSRGSLRFNEYLCLWKAAVVAEGLRLDCGNTVPSSGVDVQSADNVYAPPCQEVFIPDF